MRTFMWVFMLVVMSMPSIGHAAIPDPFIYYLRLIGMNPISGAPYGTLQTAVRAGDTPTLQVYAHSRNGAPIASADLSDFGLSSSATTSCQWLGYGEINYYPAYFCNFGPLTVSANTSDGAHTIPITVTNVLGAVSASTTSILVDNAPPTVSLTDISFSTVSPKKGDLMYLSGFASGTGSALTVSQVRETLWNAQGNSIWAPASGINYNQNLLTTAIATSTDGSFNRVPFVLNDSPSETLTVAASIKITITAYDAAGNSVVSSLMVPIPHAPPPDPCIAAGNCVSNVLFLPGIEASRLYRPDYSGGTDQLWEPNIDSDLQDLYMNPDGSSTRPDVYTKEGDVIDELPNGGNIYKSFIEKMNSLETSGVLADWEPIAYDWRLSLDDILAYGNNVQGRIYYSGDLRATSTPYILQELRHLAATSKTGKVTIVAHSNGGLLTKALTEKLGSTEAAKLIDKIIFVAVPQAGTPAAIAADLHGYGQDHVLGLVTSKSTARTFASTSPMAYNLLPSSGYFTYVDNPVVTFDQSLPELSAHYGGAIHSQELLHQFLVDPFGKVNSQAGDINQPIQMSDPLLSNAEALHANLDNWIPPTGIQLVQIAGWGIPKTIKGIEYTKSSSGSPTFTASTTIDGDGTVVVPSALWTSVTAGATNYWADLDSYNKKHPIVTLGGFHPFSHANILETDPILNFVSDQITNATRPLSDYIYLSTQAPAASDLRLRYALHSPLTLNLYDSQGRHTGVSTSTGQIEEQIPGTYYAEFGDVKYLFSDASTDARIVMDGYATGTFTFNVDQYSGDTLTASTTFKNIPTTADTMVAMDIQSDISTLSPMAIDKDGDGTVDATITPKLGDTVTLDTTPPELRITFSTTTRAVAFIGTDDMGIVTVTATTTYPALKKKQKEYHGIATTAVTARDEAGNTTTLVYMERLPSPKGRDTIVLQAIAYNGATTTIPSASLSYKWSVGKNDSYRVFASHLRTASTTLESHYRSKKNRTDIMSKPRELDDSEDDDDSDMRPVKQKVPGMVLPYMATEKGSLITSY